MKLTINVYDTDGNVTKTCEAQTLDLEFGTIRALMKILNVDNISDTGELLGVIYGAWEQVIGILGQCFPEMEEADWEHVKLKELVPTVLTILKSAFTDILSIPKNSKN